MGSGGGSSGKVNYPGYMKQYHRLLLTGETLDGADIDPWNNTTWANFLTPTGDNINRACMYYLIAKRLKDMDDDISNDRAVTDEDYTGANPYYAASAHDPDTELAEIASEVLIYKNYISGLSDYNTLYNTLITDAVTYIDAAELVISDAQINTLVAAYEDELELQHLRALNILQAQYEDLGATYGSAAAVSTALINSERARAIAKFRADLQLKQRDDKPKLVLEAINGMSQLIQVLAEGKRAGALLEFEYEKASIAAHVDEIALNLEMDEKFVLFPLRVAQFGGNPLASIAGTAVTDVQGDNKAKSAMASGALGAAGGALAANWIGAQAGVKGSLFATQAGLNAAGVTGAAPGALASVAPAAPWLIPLGAMLGIGSALLN